jgi:hypothetical protein
MVARSGGQPLWNVLKDLVKFSPLRGRPNTVLNRRLPEISARPVLSSVPFEDCSFARCADKPNTRGNVPGSRLFKEISGHARVKANIVRSSITCQSGSPPGLHVRQRSTVGSCRLKHHARIDAAESEGVTKDITERLFARLVRYHVQVTGRIRSFKI